MVFGNRRRRGKQYRRGLCEKRKSRADDRHIGRNARRLSRAMFPQKFPTVYGVTALTESALSSAAH